jgi:uncharacterized membrane protein YcaP (DUF421 family)
MDWLTNIDWQKMFVPESSILEMVIRGTIMYLGIFVLLRIFRRQAGSVGIADLIVIVVIADAAQNGMAGDSKTITEALVLIVVIVLWDYLIDWLGFKSRILAKVLDPEPLLLVKNGRIMRRNMASEMITEDELMSHLRQQGVEDIKLVKQCCLESSGDFSVIKVDDGRPEGIKKDMGATS